MAQVLRAPDVRRAPDQTTQQREPGRVRPIFVNKSLLLIRLVVGLLFIGHGSQKLFGWFGGPGMQAWTETLAKNGLQAASFWAWM